MPGLDDNGKYLAESAEKITKISKKRRILRALLSVILMLLVIMYIISILYSTGQSLTVSIDKFDASRVGLSLSESSDFTVPTSRLTAAAVEDMTNISGNSLPEDLDSQNGSHNGKNYLAYTFFLQNVGEDTVSVKYWLKMTEIKNELDKAIRVRLYVNGEATTYARTRSDGTGAEIGTTEFKFADVVMEKTLIGIAPGITNRFTVVIWLEGDDPDCTNRLIGGQMKFDIFFSVTEAG